MSGAECERPSSARHLDQAVRSFPGCVLAACFAAFVLAGRPAQSSDLPPGKDAIPPAPVFEAATWVSAGACTTGIATGDFNEDGSPDFVTANVIGGCAWGSGDLRLVLGNGDGTFQPWRSLTSAQGDYPNVVVGDFDNDGHLDLVGGGLVLLGRGDGSFGTPIAGQALAATGMVAADFNGDGHLDLAVQQTRVAETLSIQLGLGDGTFAPAVSYANAGFRPAVGDLNEDGHPDMVTEKGGMLSVRIGRGDGTFADAVTYPAGDWGSPALVDLNGDRHLDVVTADIGYPSGCVRVFFGDGSGGLVAGPVAPFADWPWDVVAGDFDDDGTPDFAFPNEHGSNLRVMFGSGDGVFSRQGLYGISSSYPSSVAKADFNRDGLMDLAVATWPTVHNDDAHRGEDNVTVLLGQKGGHFRGTRLFAAPGTQQWNGQLVVPGDFDGDGVADLLTAGVCPSCNPYQATTGLWVWKGDGKGSFEKVGLTTSLVAFRHGASGRFPSPFEKGWVLVAADRLEFVGFGGGSAYGQTALSGLQLRDVAARDLDGDGVDDILLATAGGLAVMLGGTGAPAVFPAGANPVRVAVGDLNGDGKPDAAVLNLDSANVSVFIGKGAGQFEAAVNYPATAPLQDMAIADVNDDGRGDVILAPDEIYLGSGSGALSLAPRGADPALSGYAIAVGDWNDDGRRDLALGGRKVKVFSGNGDGTFRAEPDVPTVPNGGWGWSGVDLNADGLDDLVYPADETFGIVLNGTPNGKQFYTVAPCRLADTRGPAGPRGGPVLTGGVPRSFPVAGMCDVPAYARAVAVNLTVTGATGNGNCRLYPDPAVPPLVSSINFHAELTRANNATIRLGRGGSVTVLCMGPTATHFVFDVAGYFK